MDNETIISFGGEVKSLGNGKIGGYLVKFSTANDPDLVGDYFTKDTDFGIENGVTKTFVYLNHRLPLETPKGGYIVVKSKIGEGVLSVDDNGVLIEAILYNRKQYEKALAAMGWSSGTAAHLVDRKKTGKKTSEVTAWPLGFDASMTPHPAEPRTQVMQLKSYAARKVDLPGLIDVDTKGLFTQVRREHVTRTWELWDAVQSGACRIAEAAKVEDVTGVTIDIQAKVSELVNEYAEFLIPTIVDQITGYLDSNYADGDKFYLKSLFESLLELPEPGSLMFQKHSQAMVTVARENAHVQTAIVELFQAWQERAGERLEFRETKDGRTFSQATLEEMAGLLDSHRSARESMQKIEDGIVALMQRAQPKKKESGTNATADMNQPIALGKSLEQAMLDEVARFEEEQFNRAITSRS